MSRVAIFRKLLALPVAFGLSLSAAAEAVAVSVTSPQCEYRENPVGIDTDKPRFTWQIKDPESTRGQKQTAYRIVVASSPALLQRDQGDLWDSGEVAGSQSALVPFAGKALGSNQAAYWKVRVWDKDRKPSAWSAPAYFVTGLLTPADWTGPWIQHPGLKSGEKILDVTQHLVEKVKNNALTVVAKPAEVSGGEDPASGRVKTLAVAYSIDGPPKTASVKDGETLEVAAPSGKTLEIKVALYGEIDDVAAALAAANPNRIDVRQHLWFRKNFTLAKPIASAYVNVASVGYHELYVNGRKVDDRVLAPALARLDKRVLAVTYDVARLLRPGRNTIALWTGPGWARYAEFKTSPALRVQFNARTGDGAALRLASDPSWRCTVSSSENIGGYHFGNYGGEKIDARREVPNWNAVDFDDKSWLAAVPGQTDVTLTPEVVEPTRIIEKIPVQKVENRPNGTYRLDFGKNFTGWLEFKIPAQNDGDVIVFKTSDSADTIEDFGQRSEYVCRGGQEGVFRNRLNFAAGRFVTIEGLKVPPKPTDAVGLALATDIPRVGRFSCSKELFNQIYETDLWTYRVNTTEGFTMDCPHRERYGYGEVFLATAWGIGLPNYRVGALLTKNIRDWSDVQSEDGLINTTAPQINDKWGGPLWCSAGLNVSWEFYQTHGDTRILEQHYPAWKRWVDFLNASVKDGVLVRYTGNAGRFLGEWAAPGGRREFGDTPEAQYFNNCVYAMNLETVVKMARVLGHSADVALYTQRLQALQAAIQAQFFDPQTNRYSTGGTQVQQAFALLTGVTPEKLRPVIAATIEKDITGPRPFIDAGSSGLPILLKYFIEKSDRSDVLTKVLSQTTEPSYGHFLERGETAWPEYWNVNVTSRMHTCYTGISAWMVKSLAGIRPDPARPGQQNILIKPLLAGDLTFAEAATESLYGPVVSRWERSGKRAVLTVEIPPNSSATISLPTRDGRSVTESGKDLRASAGVTPLRMENGHAVLQAEAGRYQFSFSAE